MTSPPEPRSRLVPPMPGRVLWGWAGPLLVAVLGGFLRFDRLGVPHAVVFDEHCHAGDARSMLRHGVEINHVSRADALMLAGNTHILQGTRARRWRTRRWPG